MTVLRIIFCLLLISFSSAGATFLVFTENGKSGLKNHEGKVLIPAQYDALGWSNGEFSIIENVTGFRDGSRWGLINLGNQRITKDEFIQLYPADGSLIIASKLLNKSPRPITGCITTSGKQVIPFLYDGISISSFRAVVFTLIGNQFRYGLVDLENRTLIPQQYQEVRPIGTLRYAVRNFEGKTALFSETGKQMTGFDIDSLSVFRNNLAFIYRGKDKGLINRDGVVKLEPKYRDIEVSNDNEVKIREADEWQFLTHDNKLVRKAQADSIIPLGASLFKTRTGNHAQIVANDLSVVGNSILTDIRPFSSGKALYQLGSLFGVILTDGRVVLPALYHDVLLSKEAIIASQKNGNSKGWILFDTLGNRKNNRAYESLTFLGNGLFAAKHKGFFGVVNLAGKEIVACAYDSILSMKDSHLLVKFKGLYGVITTSEEWLVSPRANPITVIDNNRFIEHAPSSTFLKERNGNVIYFTSNPVTIHKDFFLEKLPSGTVWRIDMNGVIVDRQVTPSEPTETIYEESEGYRAIKRNGRYGFIDNRGRLRIANRYEAVQPFNEGYAGVKILGKWGFINLQDNIAVQPVYEEVRPFKNGFALVKLKGLFGLIDKKGKLVLPARYENIELLGSKNMLLSVNNFRGLADVTGKILIQPRYDDVIDTGAGSAIAVKDKKYGVIGYNGVTTVPMMYDYLTFDSATNQFLAMRRATWQTQKIQ
jgi:hypothetical protein